MNKFFSKVLKKTRHKHLGIFGKYMLKFPRMWSRDACLGGRRLITKTGGKPHYGSSNTGVSNTLVLV